MSDSDSDSDYDSIPDLDEPEYFEYPSDYEDEQDSIPCSLECELDEQDEITVDNSKTLIAYTFLFRESRGSPMHEHNLIYKISPTTFYRYTVHKLESFLQSSYDDWTYYSYPQLPQIRIIQVIHLFHDQFPSEPEYRLIDKTFWLRIVQRTWKRKYAEKCRLLLQRGSLQNQHHFELRGRFLPGYQHINLLPLF
jgi:hypothetical protein